MTLNLFLLLGLIITITITFWVVVRSASHRIQFQYEALSQTLTIPLTKPAPRFLGFVRPEPYIHGIYKTREMSISVPGSAYKNTRKIETTVKVDVETNLYLSLFPKNVFTRKSTTNHQLADPQSDFEATLSLRTNHPERLNAIFTPELCARITALIKESKGRITLHEGVLAFTLLGLIATDKQRLLIKTATSILYTLAEAIELKS